MKESPSVLFVLIVSLILYLFAGVFFISDDFLQSTLEKQNERVRVFFGDHADVILDKANNGLILELKKIKDGESKPGFNKTDDSQDDLQEKNNLQNLKKIEEKTQEIYSKKLGEVFSNLFTIASLFVLMACTLEPFTLYIVIIAGVGILDGFLMREVKKITYEYSSPLKFSTALGFIRLLFPLFLFYLFFPFFGLPIWLIPVSFLFLAFSLKQLSANLIKRL